MKFFDCLIADALKLLPDCKRVYPYNKEEGWKDTGYSQVILQRESRCELSGIGFNLVTSAPVDDEVIVVGKELDEISGSSSFARISLIQIDDTEDEQKAYNLIRKIEYTKYHCFPEGYMIRSASSSQKETVRVAEKAVRSGLSFRNAGNLLIRKYKENPSVKGVQVIFVTLPDADYVALSKISEKANEITKALNHVMNSVNFDCDTCNLKPVCDEVEGMRQLHFKNKDSKNGM